MRIIHTTTPKELFIIKLATIFIILCFPFILKSQPKLSLNEANKIVDSLSLGPDEEILDFEETFQNLSLSEQLKTHTNLYYICNPDTFYDVPSYETYQFWDTVNIHPYVSDMTRYTDAFEIPFTNNKDKYYHPINKKVNSDFGWRRWRYHYGIDLDVNVGDSILCCFDGVVRIVKKSRSYGNVVVVRHYNGLETLYAHLSKNLVKVNQVVKGGELIGLGGNTGRSTGPHLHFEMRYLGGPINPRSIIDFETYNAKNEALTIDSTQFSYLKEIREIRYHTVRRGDNLGKIANRYGTSINHLCKLNRLKKRAVLRIGRRIRLT